MKSQKPQKLDKIELQNWIGKPVWYQSLTDLNDFGWSFVDPATWEVDKYTGFIPGYLLLIKPGPSHKTHYSWHGVEVFDRPAICRLCTYCEHWVHTDPKVPGRCSNSTDSRCNPENSFAPFQPKPYYQNRNFTLASWLKQVKLAGYSLEGGVA